MIIVNYQEKKLSIVTNRLSEEEEKEFLISALMAGVRWNSLTDYGDLYNIPEHPTRNDSKNLHVLVTLIEKILEVTEYKRETEICICTSTPDKLKDEIYKAIVACVRWNAVCLQEGKRGIEDVNHLAVIATFLELFAEVRTINK